MYYICTAPTTPSFWLNFFETWQKNNHLHWVFISQEELFAMNPCLHHVILFLETNQNHTNRFINTWPQNKYIYWCENIPNDFHIMALLISTNGNCIRGASCLHYYTTEQNSEFNVNPNFQLCIDSYRSHLNDSIYSFSNWIIQKSEQDERIHVFKNIGFDVQNTNDIKNTIDVQNTISTTDVQNTISTMDVQNIISTMDVQNTISTNDINDIVNTISIPNAEKPESLNIKKPNNKYYPFIAGFIGTMNEVYRYILPDVFNIPASGSLLVLDELLESETKTLGFIDMENCIFVNQNTFDQKLNFILDPFNLQKINQIRSNGQELIYTRHQLKHRLIECTQKINFLLNQENKKFHYDLMYWYNARPNFDILMMPMVTGSGLFEDVRYYVPCINPLKTFHQMIGIDSLDRCIGASNSYLTDPLFIHQYGFDSCMNYEKEYGIYKGLYNSYQYIKKNNIRCHVEGDVVMLSNSFCGTNSGHSLGNVLATILYIQKNKLPNDIKIGIHRISYIRILEIIELFIPRDRWIWIEFDIIYQFDHIHFVQVDPIFVNKESKNVDVLNLIHQIRFLAHKNWIERGLTYSIDTKILLLKQKKHCSIRTFNALSGKEFFQQANKNGWIVLDPYIHHMYYILLVLSHAKKIVISHGAIAWTHMLFFNRNAMIVYLQTFGDPIYETILRFPRFQTFPLQHLNLDAVENKNLLQRLNRL